MERKQRQQAVLAVLLVVLAAIVVYRYWYTPSPAQPAASNVRAGTGTSKSGGQTTKAPDVRLDALTAERPTPINGERNLFRFKPKAPPPPPPPQQGAATSGGNAGQPPAPVGPPPPPPIALKFIGVLGAPDDAHKLAVLRDDRGVYYGREGDIIEGRYKILHIGVESIDLSYVDGRGRQTIRLTGS